jgi:hypothetical protein
LSLTFGPIGVVLAATISQYWPTFTGSVPAGDDATSWGKLFSAFQVSGLPHAFLIDRNGKIAAHGSLNEMLTKQRELEPR